MQTTGNLGLKKPEYTDVADVAVFNANTDILDTEVAKLASTTEAGRMSATDKAKLNGVAAGANNYVHPATHPASMIMQDASNRFTSDAEKAAWSAKAGTTSATTSAAGLMSAADKAKLDGVATGANNYVAPSASLTVKGDVQLSSATNSTSEALAATPTAVKAAYDRGSAGVSAAATAQAKADAALPAASYTAADVLTKIKAVDGSGSGLDADLLRGFGPRGVFDSSNNAYVPLVNSDGGIEIGYFVDFHLPGSTADFNARLSLNSGGWLDVNSQRVWDASRLRDNAGQLEFYSGGVWKPVGVDPSRYKPFVQKGTVSPIANDLGTYRTLLSKSGKGYLKWALITPTSNFQLMNIKITIDGIIIHNSTAGDANNSSYSGSTGIVSDGSVYNSDGVYHVESRFPLDGNYRDHTYPITTPANGSYKQGVLSLPDKLYFNSSLLIEVSGVYSSYSIRFSYGGADYV